MSDSNCNGIARTTDEMSHFLDGFAMAVQSQRQTPQATGTEARVCADIAARQAMGLRKYGVTVELNQLDLARWLRHAYEECLDQAIYLKRAMEELER